MPDPRSGSKDWAKAGDAMTLAKVARIRTFFIAVSVFVGTEARLRAFLPVYRNFCEFVFLDDRPGINTMSLRLFRGIRLIIETWELSHFYASNIKTRIRVHADGLYIRVWQSLKYLALNDKGRRAQCFLQFLAPSGRRSRAIGPCHSKVPRRFCRELKVRPLDDRIDGQASWHSPQ